MIAIPSTSDFKSADIPKDPGVYLFKDEAGEILYIGKARNLRQRVKSYFSTNDKPPKTRKLVGQIRNVDWIVVNNEVEALLLENKLVKQHTPKYNINLKDAKTYAYIALTREIYPRILTSRKTSRKLESFGPYTDGFARQDLQRLVIRLFKLRICKNLPKRACLNFHIGLCTAPCIENVTATQYATQVEQARSFLSGDYEKTSESLIAQMKAASEEMKYERAMELRNHIASIKLLRERQIVDNERHFDQDLMAFKRLDGELFVVQMGVRKGVLLGKKDFSIDFSPHVKQEFLKAFYSANLIPREILLNQSCWQGSSEKKALEEFLSTKRGGPVSIAIPRKGEKLGLIRLAEKNIEYTLNRDSALIDLQNALNLPSLPRIIECFDVSNLGYEHIVSGMVRFTDAKPDKSNYRKFKVKFTDRQNDLAAMNEVITRRYGRLIEEHKQLPDLVVIDGGPGQVTAAHSAIKSLGLQLPLIGLAKKHEEIFLPNESTPLQFNRSSRMMLLLRQIRDVTHNFSIRYNRKRRQMKMKEEFQKFRTKEKKDKER
ncbi:excinuclease ABC subunit UvrC [Candidatus Bathyarchaeota archaeon]|nr:excinuclease ABC subunit UvrC [Candidatus Bathyarchaeota archaeon]